MGRKIVSRLFGGFARKKKSSSQEDLTCEDDTKIENSEFSLMPEYECPQPKPSGGLKPHHRSCSASATSKLARNLSIGVRQFAKREDKKLDGDSVWKKTIILGEKCKVPSDDEDDALYDENGDKISTFHRKSTGSWATASHHKSTGDLRSLSRQNSRHVSNSDIVSHQNMGGLRSLSRMDSRHFPNSDSILHKTELRGK